MDIQVVGELFHIAEKSALMKKQGNTQVMDSTKPPQVVMHVPHASREIPPQFLGQFLLDQQELAKEIIRMTDSHTDELFAMPPNLASTVCHGVSRLLVDPERFENDDEEPMAARGMGVIYQRTSMRTPLRNVISNEERNELLDLYYRPHHAELTRVTSRALDAHGQCLIIDAHSFPSQPWPYEIDQSPNRPEICIGTDDFHTPEALKATVMTQFTDQGFSVAINIPFSGSLVPSAFYNRDSRVSSIMIEVRRDLYMNELNGDKATGYHEFFQRFQSVLRNLAMAYVS
ncbi:MAG: N-formylglutamate amidohydrolase [Planctomycetes bacterium]|nr:N-formylglutamate amidohydrolase [Planctomycetota bacterium]